MILECKLNFEAAHRNTSPQATERMRRLHGHSYEVTIAVEGIIDATLGWVMDFAEVKEIAKDVIDCLDHRILNDIDGMHDTTRVDLARWITEKLRPVLPALRECSVTVLGDTDWSPRITRISEGRECLQFSFAAAHFLPALPESHKCRRVHGHSFRVTVISKEASRLAEPLLDLYQRIDHQLLNDVAGLDNPTSEMLANWLAKELKQRKCAFDEIAVAETCTSSCRLIMT